jgi:dihydrodipicolinate synthase/N-acetylneuraminate lyase
MIAEFEIVVPALAFRSASGELDLQATRVYAERAAGAWVDYFILSGSTTRGHEHTSAERAAVLDLWLDVTEAVRLLACCWDPEDLTNAADRGIAPIAVMRGLPGRVGALAFLEALPRGAYIYSHPMFGGAVFDAELARAADARGVAPAGGKLARVSAADITEIRAAVGDAFQLWDGSSRRIRASLEAGASGVVATPLCAFDQDLLSKDVDPVQAVVSPVQDVLDGLPDRAARTAELLRRAQY